MNENKTNEKRATTPETNRRDFLKTGAAFAGAALLGEAFRVPFASAADENPQDLKDVQMLFVQNAKDVVMEKGRLTLIGVSPTTIFFSDRPKRIAGHMYTEDFVLEWRRYRCGVEKSPSGRRCTRLRHRCAGTGRTDPLRPGVIVYRSHRTAALARVHCRCPQANKAKNGEAGGCIALAKLRLPVPPVA